MRFLSRLFKPEPARTLIPQDMHCHLLPGVDDGVSTFDDALHCLQGLQRLGYTGVTLTPHIYPEVFDNNEQDLRRAFTDFQRRMSQALPGFNLTLGAEYFCDDHFRRRMHDAPSSLLTAGADGRTILVEFSTHATLHEVSLHVHDLLLHNLRPMLAHVERYPFLHDAAGLEHLHQWRSAGVRVQVNAGSLAGQYGSKVKASASLLCSRGVVDALGTDLHKHSHLAWVERGWRIMAAKRDWQASLDTSSDTSSAAALSSSSGKGSL